jgi:hypothetical protein
MLPKHTNQSEGTSDMDNALEILQSRKAAFESMPYVKNDTPSTHTYARACTHTHIHIVGSIIIENKNGVLF